MLWKLNAAFPSVVWQIYDWYLEPNAGYYFMQRACEPVHIQLNLDDSAVAVINRTYLPRRGLSVHASVLGLNGDVLYEKSAPVSLDTTDVREVLHLGSVLATAPGVSFVVLELTDAAGKQLSHNVYWMAPGNDFTSLRSMPSAHVTQTVLRVEKTAKEYRYTIRFQNNSRVLAFFLNPQIVQDGAEIMPCFWSDNYFSVPAGSSTTVTVAVPVEKIGKGNLSMVLEGWNTGREESRLL